MARASRTIEIGVPPEAFFRVLQDYQSYPEFVPELKAVKVGPRSGNTLDVTYFLDVKIKVYEYTLRHVEEAPLRADWQLVRGGELMKRDSGSWVLEAISSGTRATYSIELELGPLVPRGLEKALEERGLPNLLANFKARAEKLQRG